MIHLLIFIIYKSSNNIKFLTLMLLMISRIIKAARRMCARPNVSESWAAIEMQASIAA
jgi:hypothetical protein